MKFPVELIILLHAKFITGLPTSILVQKTIQIAEATFEPNFSTSIVWCSSNNHLQDISDFLRRFTGSVVLTPVHNGNYENCIQSYKEIGYKQTIFFASDVDEFAKFIVTLKPVLVVPIRLILVLTKPTTNVDISNITETAWNNDLADIIILSVDEEDNIKQTTYEPYSSGICGDHSPIQIKQDAKIWFPKKFLNFHGCPIRTALLHVIPYSNLTIDNGTIKSIDGLDGLVLKLLMNKLNATVDELLCEDMTLVGTYVNGTATGCFAELMYKRVDMFFPTLAIDYLRYPVAQISYVFEMIEVYWFGPPRRQREQWLKIIQPFLTETSQAILISFISFIIVVTIVKRYGFQRANSKMSVIFQSFMIFLGQEVRFESRSWLLNSLFIKWIWFCMIVRIVYQGDLVDGLQSTILENPLINMIDAIKEVDGYGGLEISHDVYMGTSYFKIYKVMTIPDVRESIRKISDGKRFLLAATKVVAFELGNDLQMLKDPILRAPLCFFMRPGWPASKDINTVIMRLTEAGFPEKVLRDSNYNWNKKQQVYEDREAHSLNIYTLSGCFLGLDVLFLICILVFIAEIIYHKLTSKTKNNLLT